MNFHNEGEVMNLDTVFIYKNEYLLRKFLKHFIEVMGSINNLTIFKDSKDLFKKINKKYYDLFISEIDLKYNNALFLKDSLKNDPISVFLGDSKKHPKKEAIKNSNNYIKDPLNFDNFKNLISRIIDDVKNRDILLIQSINKIINLNIRKTYYITKEGRYTIIKNVKKDYICIKPMKYFENKLKNKNFLRIHRSYLINCNFIEKVKKSDGRNYIVKLHNNEENIKVGRKYKNDFKIYMEEEGLDY